MSWLDIFKKVFEGEKQEKQEVPTKQISLQETLYTIQESLKEREKKLDEMKKSALEKIEKFKLDIEMNVRVLENVNLEKRKENEKLKLTVLDNLKLYVDYLRNLIRDLDSINSLPPTQYLLKASKQIESFNKNSKSAYEKATILIGDELGRTRETVKSFLSTISEILKSSKMVGEEVSAVSIVRKNYERIEEIKRNIEDLEKLDSESKGIIERISKQEEENKQEIEKTKKSEGFKASEKEKETIKEELSALNNKIQEIKQKIDLKLLSKYYHTDLKKSSLINKYIDNFKEAMKKDTSLEIVSIVRESKGIDVSVLEEIRKREKELLSLPESEIDKKISLLNAEIEKQESERRSKEKEIEDNKKKADKLREREKELIEELKLELEKLNISFKE